MRRIATILLASAGLCLLASVGCRQAPPAKPKSTPGAAAGYAPIPPGFGFPGNEAQFVSWSRQQKMAQMREHGWSLWAAINQPAGGGQFVWQTWWSITQAEATPPSTGTAATAPRQAGSLISRNIADIRRAGGLAVMAQPGQYVDAACRAPIVMQPCYGTWNPSKHSCVDPANGDGLRYADNGDIMIAGEYYSQEAYDHIRTNKLYLTSSLNPATGPSIPDFPRKSVVLKVMQWPVSAQGYTALPVWDNTPTNPITGYNGYETWKRAVAIDPSGKPIAPGATVTVSYLFGVTEVNVVTGKTTPLGPITFHNAHVVPISDFIHHRVTAAEWAAMDPGDKALLNQSARWAYNRDFRPGDSLITVATHIITREMPDWAMQTFWWHDHPNDGPYAENRPASLPAGPWSNYLMCTAWNMDTPHEYDGTPYVCSNPYIELVVPEACRISTNCQNCHTRAAWPTQQVQPQGGAHYDTSVRGYISPHDPIFKGLKRTDFQWAIADRAHK